MCYCIMSSICLMIILQLQSRSLWKPQKQGFENLQLNFYHSNDPIMMNIFWPVHFGFGFGFLFHTQIFGVIKLPLLYIIYWFWLHAYGSITCGLWKALMVSYGFLWMHVVLYKTKYRLSYVMHSGCAESDFKCRLRHFWISWILETRFK